ncbi:MAG: PAS domain S-box protein [Candidatus Marinimicrobia bacterium]|nr:PAS domain S-box protein [Candidatus Neomarinimicrobiota bacterium]
MSDGIFRKDAVIKILLVEDSPADARLLREMLADVTTAQFELTLVERLSDAVQRLSEESFDVVLLDMMLPDSAGLDILLRAQEVAPGLPMIVLTGTFEDEALAVKAVQEGAQDYLFKDQVDGILLVRSIRYAIERKRAEEELKASQEYLRNLIDCSLDMIIAVDRNRRITEFNRAAEETFGYRREDVLGKHANILYADSQVGLEAHKTAVEQGQSVQEILNKRKNGKVFPSLLCASVLLDSQGRRVGVMGISRDITEKKQAEEALQKAHDELEDKVKERTAELEQSNMELKGEITLRKHAEEQLKKSHDQLRRHSARLQTVKEEERENLARELHDEMGHSLTALKIDLVSLLNDPLIKSKPQADDLQSMISLTDDSLQTVKRIATELRPGVLDQLGIGAAIEWQLKEFQSRTQIKCEVRLPEERLGLGKDKDIILFRILQEALTNVARHAQATNIVITLQKDKQSISMTVQDDGRGIEESEVVGMRSLGLLGMRERSHLVGGKLTITGEQGKGTTISVSVPID